MRPRPLLMNNARGVGQGRGVILTARALLDIATIRRTTQQERLTAPKEALAVDITKQAKGASKARGREGDRARGPSLTAGRVFQHSASGRSSATSEA